MTKREEIRDRMEADLEMARKILDQKKVGEMSRKSLQQVCETLSDKMPESRRLKYQLLKAAALPEADDCFLSVGDWALLNELSEASIRRQLRRKYKQGVPSLLAAKTLFQETRHLAEELPTALGDDSIVLDGERYVTSTAWAIANTISPKAVFPRVASLTPIKGKTTLGRIRDYYREVDIDNVCKELIETDKANDDGFFVKEDVTYGMAEAWSNLTQTSKSSMYSRLKNAAWISGKDRSGRIAKFYAQATVYLLMGERLELPKTNKDGFVDIQGVQYGTVTAWNNKYGDLTPNKLSGAVHVKGIEQNGLSANLYSYATIKGVLKTLPKNLPRANNEGIIRVNNEDYRTIGGWQKLLGKDFRVLENLLVNAQGIQGKATNGNVTDYYPEEIVRGLVDEEYRRDTEFEKLSSLGLEEAAAFFRNDPWKFKEYLQFAHPELSEEEMDRLTIRSFHGMRMGSLEKNEEKYLKWDTKLSSINLTEEPPEVTAEPTITIMGTVAPNATHIFIAGAYTRTKRIDEGENFALTIPLKIGQTNELRIMSIDKNGKKRSEQESFMISQKGKQDDVAALVDLLSQLKDITIAGIQQNPGRFQHLCRCMEQSLIKRFGRSFADGERYIRDLIERGTTAPAIRKVLGSVLSKFKKIHEAKIPGTVPGSLLFFQKYCAVDIRRRIEEELLGVFLANAPGTGKTRIIQAAIADMDTTVITPNSVVSAWDEESGKVLEDTDVLALRGVSHAVRKEQLRTRKRLRATVDTPQHIYINREFLQRVDDSERFKLLSDKETVVVHDEGHSRANEQSLQSKGAAMLDSKFQILVSATPFKNPRTFRRMMTILRPKDKRFSSDAAFTRAFPADDPQALRTLSLLKQDVTLRFREEDVFETVDPKQSLSQQRHKLPAKEFIDPEKIGSFEMSEDQAESIYQMFVNWNRWCKTNNKYIPKDRTAKEDHLRVGDGFAKRHALRQTVNNPSYINSKAPDHKLIEAKKIVQQCMKEGRKVVIFCAYEAQTQKYAEAFANLHPALYTGETSALGDVKDLNSKPIKFRKGESEDDHHAWVLDSSGRPVPDPDGQTMSALDYERITFQNIADRKLLIATYSAGSVGSTFTAGNAMILDDLPSDCVEAIQAEGRIRRIDPNRLTHAVKKYYTLESQYPAAFMERVSKRWLVKQEHFYKEFDSRESARKYAEKRGLKYMNAAEEFFDQGTYDEVHSRNLKVQRMMFNLINDGIADESILSEDQEMFRGLANGKSKE